MCATLVGYLGYDVVRRLDPDVPIADVKTYESLIEGRALLFARFAAILTTALGGLALVLAVVVPDVCAPPTRSTHAPPETMDAVTMKYPAGTSTVLVATTVAPSVSSTLLPLVIPTRTQPSTCGQEDITAYRLVRLTTYTIV